MTERTLVKRIPIEELVTELDSYCSAGPIYNSWIRSLACEILEHRKEIEKLKTKVARLEKENEQPEQAQDECPEDECWHWIPPGGAAEMSGKTFRTLEQGFKEGDWKQFPYGGCSCVLGKCKRLHPDGTDDFFEPCE